MVGGPPLRIPPYIGVVDKKRGVNTIEKILEKIFEKLEVPLELPPSFWGTLLCRVYVLYLGYDTMVFICSVLYMDGYN